MVVRNVWDQGARLPESAGNMTEEAPVKVPASVQAIAAARAQGAAERAYLEAAGGSPQESGKQDLSSQLVIQSMKDRAEIHQSLIAAKEAAEKSATDMMREYWKVQIERLSEAEARLASAGTSQAPDAMSSVRTAMELFKMVKSEMAPAAAPAAPRQEGPDGSTLIALKNIDLQIVTMQNNFNLQLEEMRQNREREKQKWEEEKELKKEELALRREEMQNKGKTQSEAAAGLQDLVGSVIAGLDSRGASAGASVSKLGPNQFACAACGKPVDKPPAGVNDAPCTACGRMHVRRGSQNAVAQPPGEEPPVDARPRVPAGQSEEE